MISSLFSALIALDFPPPSLFPLPAAQHQETSTPPAINFTPFCPSPAVFSDILISSDTQTKTIADRHTKKLTNAILVK